MALPCKDCASGYLKDGAASGTVTTVHGLPTYVAEPASAPKGIVVIITDAFGWELPNNRILADNYAKKGGFKVYMPDFMNGHWLPHDMLDTLDNVMDEKQSVLWKIYPVARTVGWFAPFLFFNRQSVTGPRIFNFFKALRANEGSSLPVGVAGFCWGGFWTAKLCADTEKTPDGRSLIDAGFTAHPSMLSVPAEIEPVKLPLSIANGTKDFQLTPALMEQVKEIFSRKENCELVVYDGAKHGFAVRSNPNNEREKQQELQAEDQAVAWFNKWFGKVGGPKL